MKKQYSFIRGLKEFPKHITIHTFSQGLVTGIAGWGFALMLYAYGNACGWDNQTVTSWIFTCWGLGCCVGIYLACKYQMPITGAWSISGAAIAVSGCMSGLTLPQLCTGYLLSGFLVLLLGLSGAVSKVMKVLPMPIVMGMTAGCLFKFGTNIVDYVYNYSIDIHTGNNFILLAIVLITIIVYILFSRFKIAWLPPVLVSLFVVAIGVLAFGLYDGNQLSNLHWTGPQFVGYSFKDLGNVFVSITLPLTLLVIGAENTQAIGIISGLGYEAPVKSMTVVSGLGGMAASLFGGHNANIAGPMTALCASEESGPLEDRYASTVISMLFTSLVAIFASIVVPFLNSMPVTLIYTIAGLSLMGVILGCLQSAFSAEKFQLSALFAFVIALSQQSFLGIGSAFWALLIGFVVAAIVESKDLKDMMAHGS